MFLKRLEISGFKSFAEKTVLDFEGKDGKITSIIGPNGSGKSNIVDAIRWVLGEQSYRLMRSKKSEDVVFFGSSGKQKGSAATVTMTLDNSKSEIPIDFSEVQITRKVYRSGESEYLINKSRVRLIDIHELLSKCGFGQTTYTVLGQGMVDQLLFYGPTERKVLFDEAAGVKKYQIKREQSIKKLEATDKNLIRLKDISTELEPRVENLKRLVKRAEGREVLETELLDSQNRYYSSIFFDLEKKLKLLGDKKITLNEKIKLLGLEVETLNKTIEKSSLVSPFENEKKTFEIEISGLLTKRDEYLRQVAFTQGQIDLEKNKFAHLEREEALLKSEKLRLEEKIPFLKGKIAVGQEEIKEAQKENNSLKQNIESLEAKLKSFDKALSDEKNTEDKNETKKLAEKLSLKQEEKRKLENLIIELKAKDLEFKFQEKRDKERKIFLENEINELNNRVKILEQEFQDDNKQKKELEIELGNLSKDLFQSLKSLETKELELRELLGKQSPEFLNDVKKDLSALEILSKEITKGGTAKLKEFDSFFGKFISKIKNYIKANDINEREKVEKGLKDLKKKIESGTSLKNEKNLELMKIISKIENIELKKQELTNLKDERTKELKKNSVHVTSSLDIGKLKKIETDLNNIEAEIEKIESTYKKISQSEIDRQNEILLEKNKTQNECSKFKSELHSKEVGLFSKKHILENQEKEFNESEIRLTEILSRISQREKSGSGSSAGLEKLLDEKKQQLSKVDTLISEARASLSNVIEKERDFSKAIFEKERAIRLKESEIVALRQDLSSLQIEEARISVKKEDTEEEVNLLHLPFQKIEIKESLPDIERMPLRSKIENIRRRLEAIGDVDSETKEEYDELSLRHEEIFKQIEDLKKAKEDLEKIIKELDAKIKVQFEESFKTISKEFSRYFKILFEGGVATLSLERTEIESGSDFGIEITACPPGKKVKSLNALSGGERTLTSLALLFAILSVNPSPFVVLDEVDAALDELNTKRFLKIIEDLCHKTQFIVITHNRESMKIASSLYGVTMDDNHISKVISLKLTEVAK